MSPQQHLDFSNAQKKLVHVGHTAHRLAWSRHLWWWGCVWWRWRGVTRCTDWHAMSPAQLRVATLCVVPSGERLKLHVHRTGGTHRYSALRHAMWMSCGWPCHVPARAEPSCSAPQPARRPWSRGGISLDARSSQFGSRCSVPSGSIGVAQAVAACAAGGASAPRAHTESQGRSHTPRQHPSLCAAVPPFLHVSAGISPCRK